MHALVLVSIVFVSLMKRIVATCVVQFVSLVTRRTTITVATLNE